jgi:hypothetical protein
MFQNPYIFSVPVFHSHVFFRLHIINPAVYNNPGLQRLGNALLLRHIEAVFNIFGFEFIEYLKGMIYSIMHIVILVFS